MCLSKKNSIKVKYHNPCFGDYADQCLVGVISYLNEDEEFATIASCCGHGNSNVIPYITLLLPASRVDEVKNCLEAFLLWENILIVVFEEIPDDALRQLGDFVVDKIHVGYYSNAKDIVIENLEWGDDDF